MSRAIWWIRRDLRISDNLALQIAIQGFDEVVPLFIVDEALIGGDRASKKRNAFLFSGLRDLKETIIRIGGQLVIKCGNPTEVFEKLAYEIGFDQIYAEEDFSPFAKKRDGVIQNNFDLRLVNGLSMIHPELITKSDGEPYKVYTPFMKRWKQVYHSISKEIIKSPSNIKSLDSIGSDLIPEYGDEDIHFTAGEGEAQKKLSQFVSEEHSGIYGYGLLRDMPSYEGTSTISPYLKFGMVSIRQTFDAAFTALDQAITIGEKDSVEKWINELIWREFYQYILYHFPNTRYSNFRSKYDDILWEDNPEDIQAWKLGKTGFPFVDAGMRQLIETGWMHNRLRMVAASFLVKNLLVDWRLGEQYFMQQLIDGDTSSNVGGWQWVAGTGTDAAPYFRIFNPITQGIKFDPGGDYIRRWVPELGAVPDKFIHTPWKLSQGDQREAGCIIGIDYPKRIVDIKASRERALTRYKV